ncbi:MAG: hypothetical protein IJE97_14105, partial [Thermoguttaceae bacterium]|nr:hypothetical protein [Thermoguttaceae bacterium]
MARILAIDWDGVEARFALGSVQKDRLIVWKAGSAPIVDAAAAVAEAEKEAEADDEDDEDAGFVPSTGDDEDENVPPEWDEDDEGDDSPIEIVETAGVKKAPVFDEDDEEEEDDDPRVVSATRRKKGESFKTSPLATTLKNLLREHRVGSATVVYSAERGDLDVLYTTVPLASDAETPELVLNQALREWTAFDAKTQPLDYLPLGTPSRVGTRSVVAVSIARDKQRRVRETLIGATRAPSKIELREPSLAEFLRADFCKLAFDEPTLLIQALCDEVNLTLCDAEKNVLYFRSFKVATDLPAPALARRIREEIARTLAVGIADLPEDVAVRKALFFSDASSLSAAALGADYDDSDADEHASITEIGEDEEDAASVVVESLQLGEHLARELEGEEIELEFANPFRVPGVQLKTLEPENPGRFASLLGMLLAERPQYRPAIDLLHPREKPKPPKYWAIVVAFLILAGAGFGAAWNWNKAELERERAAVAELQQKAQKEYQYALRKQPLANVLMRANNWRDRQGVVVLDELRDIALRIPGAPDLVVTRLGYLANQNGRPTFIIQAKIKSTAVYQTFRQSLTADRSHSVLGRGPVPNRGGGGYPYMFDARIVCQRRAAQTFVAKLPPELRQISNNMPEYFAERQLEIQREREEAAAKAAAERAEALRRQQEEAQKRAEEARRAQEAAAQAQQASGSAPAPAPEQASESAPAPAPEQASESAPAPAPEQASESTPAPAPEQASESAPAPTPEQPAESTPAPAPEQASESAPAPAPEQASESAPAPAPEQPAESAPAPAPEQASESAPAPAPEQASESTPAAQPAQNGQATPTPEQQAQFGFQLMRQKAQLDARLQFAQNRLRAGQMNQAQYQQTLAQYQTLTRNVMSRWSALPEAARKKAQETWNEELKKQQNAQAGQNGRPSTPVPAPAAEQPSTPAPAPAAEQPSTPAPAPAA